MREKYLTNFSYLFIPFTTARPEDFSILRNNIGRHTGWKSEPINNRYLHRYVAQRITNNDPNVCCHFVIRSSFAQQRGFGLYSTDPKVFGGAANDGFQFKIVNAELFVFDTSIGILVLELQFPEDDPLKIASAQYYLRKISTEKIHALTPSDGARRESFVGIARRLLGGCAGKLGLDFFFYATEGNEKAHFLTYIDVPERESYDKELFYLKWCYNDGFDFQKDLERDSIDYKASDNIQWGMSVSAAVCLVSRTPLQKAFIENTFQTNFRKQYLLTYILLLHQKYMMYLFLTKLSFGIDGNLEQLKKYKELLYIFETRYMFTYISEVPQYQRFYSKVQELFALKQLFEDVQEPLLQLTEMQKQKSENEQQARDHRVNTALTTLSFLTIVSALADAIGLVSGWDWLISQRYVHVGQVILSLIIAAISIVMTVRLLCTKSVEP